MKYVQNRLSIPTLILALIATPALAQQNSKQSSQASAESKQSNAKQDKQTQQPNEANRRPSLKIDPMARVAVAVDRNNDGRFDTIETVTYYDLQIAMERSKQRERDNNARRTRQRPSSQQNRNPGDQANREMRMRPTYNESTHRAMQAPGLQRSGLQRSGLQGHDRQRMQMIKVSGTIVDMTDFTMADNDKHRFAKLELSSGVKVPVDLGPVKKIDSLDLEEGDEITVIGKRARINDKKFVCARQVMAGDKKVAVNQKPDRDMKRVQGRITELMTKQFKGKDQPFHVAKVDLQGGRNELVILGPQDSLKDLPLSEGQKVRLLVRLGSYNERPALIASQVNVDDQTVQIEQPRKRQVTTREQANRS